MGHLKILQAHIFLFFSVVVVAAAAVVVDKRGMYNKEANEYKQNHRITESWRLERLP